MRLLLQSSLLALLLVSSSYSVAANDSITSPTDYSCTIKGASGEDACKSAVDADGDGCEWCQISSYGLCVNEEQAEAIEKTIPIASCGGGDDYDDAVIDDDDDGVPPEDDDNAAGDDDNTPPDYWDCLKSTTDEASCTANGCTWCDTKGGYGLCLDKDAAAAASKSDWYTCTENLGIQQAIFADPYDTTCLAATLQGDEACAAAKDADGQPCEWCAIGSVQMCLSGEQGEIATQLGGSCDENAQNDQAQIGDPYDPSCLEVSLTGDKTTCLASDDEDGESCEWCTIGSAQLCLTGDQGEIAEQLGGSCDTAAVAKVEIVKDPLDPTCLEATLQMDEDTCVATMDADGNACEWCTVGSTPLCLNQDQAQIAEQLGGSCDAQANKAAAAQDPYDPSCLEATLSGDESTCLSTKDEDGQACEWCTVGSTQMCLTGEQATIAEQIGASCDTVTSILHDPLDTSCLAASIQMDKASCIATLDATNQSCEWCVVGTAQLCLNSEQADIATQLGGSCDAEEQISNDVMDAAVE